MEIQVNATVPMKVGCAACGAAEGLPCAGVAPSAFHVERLRAAAKAAFRLRARPAIAEAA